MLFGSHILFGNHMLFGTHILWRRRASPLSSRAKPRDLRFYEPLLEMFLRS